ncbi:hypothetical protein, partial [Aeromonas hydrophila]
MNTLGGHDGVIDESLNSHRWVGSGWCNLISPPSRPATVFFACLPARCAVTGQKNGSSRDLGEVEVDRQGAGKLAVSK